MNELNAPIRIAAIGVGHWHALYDAAYLKRMTAMPGITLAAVHDPDAAILAARASALGDPPTFTDHRTMLDTARPDFVLVLGRHDAMAAAGRDVIDAGLPLLIEKPAGLTATAVRRLADHAAAANVFAAVPLFQRLHPFVRHARQRLADGAFGSLSHFHFRSVRGSAQRYVDWGSPWMLDPAASGGGCLRNIGTHGLDLFLHLLGEDAEVVAAQTGTLAHGQRVEDTAFVQLRAPSGVLGAIEVATTFPGKGAEASWTLSGRDGLLTMAGGKLRWVTASGEQELDATLPEPLPAIALKDALRRWQRGEPPAVSLADCARVAHLVDRAYELAGT